MTSLGGKAPIPVCNDADLAQALGIQLSSLLCDPAPVSSTARSSFFGKSQRAGILLSYYGSLSAGCYSFNVNGLF